MGRVAILGLAAVVCAGSLGCAERNGAGGGAVSGPSGGGANAPEIGLRRGYAWSTLTFHPPHITGPNATMLLKDSVLSGAISGSRMHVRIEQDGAEGYGPAGPVALHFTKGPASVEVDGTWNGYRVHLDFAEDSLQGTVASSGGALEGGPRRIEMMASGEPHDPGIVSYATCEYSLKDLGTDGALSGSSICGGMPEPTRLEVPKLIRAYMTRSELVVVLVALLSTPPMLGSESVSAPS